ncbi:hypothetical protein GCM10007160_18170 [Litchfieldella qijiaojingensis]|uniref:Uncharacterized protein n=1 Tax=Litchfieldella qijiaojingensis TaxID=980347 RepID=A0ABQ2YPL3_9GAMM|nr:hypothetical protein [Halomonas qijiaojingensis]GGX91060.1 hypothetical protein GCM10007160_18170 [Halomonas qijiaojingensis]
MRNVAYFVGGPEDLTKRVLYEPLPVIRFPELLPLDSVRLDAAGEEPVDVPFRTHNYERMHHHRSFSTQEDVFIYVYMGNR